MFINNDNPAPQGDLNRRKFIATTTKAIGSVMLLSPAIEAFAMGEKHGTEAMTVGQIMDLFISEVPGAPFATTVDTLKAGNRDIKVTGIITTMFATLGVIQKAIANKVNFIIAHEPTFYNHQDDTNWLQQDEVYQYKAALLKEHNIAVWRNHDYIHTHVPDGVITGVTNQLGWSKVYDMATQVATINSMSLQEVIDHAKAGLGIIGMVRYIGNLQQPCKRVLILPGAPGGKRQIEAIGKQKPDVVLCGEVQEWETAEYVRDAQTKGQQLSLVVLGHIASEEPGSAYMATWLQQKVPGINVLHIPPGNSLSFV